MGRYGYTSSKNAGEGLAILFATIGGFLGYVHDKNSTSSIVLGAVIGLVAFLFIFAFFVWTGFWGVIAVGVITYLLFKKK